MAVVLAARRFVGPRQAAIAAALSSSQTQAIVTPSLGMRCAVPTGCQPPSLAVRGVSTASTTASLPGILRAAASVGALPSRNAGLSPSGVPGVTARATAAADSNRTLFGYKFQRCEIVYALVQTGLGVGSAVHQFPPTIDPLHFVYNPNPMVAKVTNNYDDWTFTV